MHTIHLHSGTPMGRAALLLALALASAQHAAALYSRGSDVAQLGEKELSKLLAADGVAAVEFYAPW